MFTGIVSPETACLPSCIGNWLIATESVSIALTLRLLPPEVGVNRLMAELFNLRRHVSVKAARSRGPPRRVSAYEISKSTGFQVDFGFQNGFLDFKVDFWISKWISGFQSGFLDFKADFWISKWISREISGFQATFWISKRISGLSKWISRGISGFQANFWISKRISGFHLNRYYSKIELKYTHDSSTAFLSACMLTEYKVTGTSPLRSA